MNSLSSDSASWSGILFDNVAGTGIDSMVYFAIRDAEIGIEARSPILLRDGSVSTTYNTGVYASDSLTLRRVTVSESDGQGLYLGSGVVADIIDSDFDNHTSSGVVCDTCSHQSSFSGGTASENGLHGIHLKSSYAGVTSMAVKNNDYSGIRVIGGSGDISSCSIDGNGTGVYCYAGSEPTIGYCEIRGNTNGVTAAESSYPHLGEGGPSNPTGGHHCFYKTNGTHISVLSDPTEPVYANYNYWGHPQVCCPSAKLYGYIICGNCDTSAQCDAPQGVSPPTDRDDPRLPVKR